jgi:hypothetical protein
VPPAPTRKAIELKWAQCRPVGLQTPDYRVEVVVVRVHTCLYAPLVRFLTENLFADERS